MLQVDSYIAHKRELCIKQQQIETKIKSQIDTFEERKVSKDLTSEKEIEALTRNLRNTYSFEEIANALEKNLSWVMGELRAFEVTTDKLVCRLGKLVDFMYDRVHDKMPNKVLVRNLAQHYDEKTIKTLFEVCGDVEAIEMVMDNKGGFNGTAYVTFENIGAAKMALLM